MTMIRSAELRGIWAGEGRLLEGPAQASPVRAPASWPKWCRANQTPVVNVRCPEPEMGLNQVQEGWAWDLELLALV